MTSITEIRHADSSVQQHHHHSLSRPAVESKYATGLPEQGLSQGSKSRFFPIPGISSFWVQLSIVCGIFFSLLQACLLFCSTQPHCRLVDRKRPSTPVDTALTVLASSQTLVFAGLCMARTAVRDPSHTRSARAAGAAAITAVAIAIVYNITAIAQSFTLNDPVWSPFPPNMHALSDWKLAVQRIVLIRLVQLITPTDLSRSPLYIGAYLLCSLPVLLTPVAILLSNGMWWSWTNLCITTSLMLITIVALRDSCALCLSHGLKRTARAISLLKWYAIAKVAVNVLSAGATLRGYHTQTYAVLATALFDSLSFAIPCVLQWLLFCDGRDKEMEEFGSMTRFVRWLAHEVRVPTNNCLVCLQAGADVLNSPTLQEACSSLFGNDDPTISATPQLPNELQSDALEEFQRRLVPESVENNAQHNRINIGSSCCALETTQNIHMTTTTTTTTDGVSHIFRPSSTQPRSPSTSEISSRSEGHARSLSVTDPSRCSHSSHDTTGIDTHRLRIHRPVRDIISSQTTPNSHTTCEDDDLSSLVHSQAVRGGVRSSSSSIMNPSMQGSALFGDSTSGSMTNTLTDSMCDSNEQIGDLTQLVGSATSAITQMREVLDNALDVARMHSDDYDIDLQPFNMVELFDTMMTKATEEFVSSGTYFTYELVAHTQLCNNILKAQNTDQTSNLRGEIQSDRHSSCLQYASPHSTVTEHGTRRRRRREERREERTGGESPSHNASFSSLLSPTSSHVSFSSPRNQEAWYKKVTGKVDPAHTVVLCGSASPSGPAEATHASHCQLDQLWMLGVEDRVARVMDNLISNARKYGGGRVHVRMSVVPMRARDSNNGFLDNIRSAFDSIYGEENDHREKTWADVFQIICSTVYHTGGSLIRLWSFIWHTLFAFCCVAGTCLLELVTVSKESTESFVEEETTIEHGRGRILWGLPVSPTTIAGSQSSTTPLEWYKIVFTICDRGIGFEEDEKDKIFTPFSQLRSGDQGSGLGLSLCKATIERHGGTISAQSFGRGKGATFTFSLPLQAVPPEMAEHVRLRRTRQSFDESPHDDIQLERPNIRSRSCDGSDVCDSVHDDLNRLSYVVQRDSAGDERFDQPVSGKEPESNQPVSIHRSSRESFALNPVPNETDEEETKVNEDQNQEIAPSRLGPIGSPLGENLSCSRSTVSPVTMAPQQSRMAIPSWVDTPVSSESESCARPPTVDIMQITSAAGEHDTPISTVTANTTPTCTLNQQSSTDSDVPLPVCRTSTVTPARILLVDDVPMTLKLMKRVLSRQNRRPVEAIDTALDGVQALEQLNKRGVDFYTHIFTDAQMPHMDGYEFTAAVHQLGYTGALVGVTGNSVPADVQYFLEAGAHEVITKPVDREQLVDSLVNR